MLLILLATFLRFSHFVPVQKTTEQTDPQTGEKTQVVTTVEVTFWYVVTTMVVLPPLYALFILVEFKLHNDIVGKYFGFLKNEINKGVFLIMLALMINDVQNTVEIIFLIVICALSILEIVLGIIKATLTVNSDQNAAII